jgi:predicted Rossmann fold nucleotide-binding protein DprA/Smf involved in DNA uptake
MSAPCLPGLFDQGDEPTPQPTAPWSGAGPTAETSKAAAHAIRGDLNRLEQRVLDAIRARPSTCDEVEQATGLSHQTCSARVNALHFNGRILPIGQRPTRSGRKAVIWE